MSVCQAAATATLQYWYIRQSLTKHGADNKHDSMNKKCNLTHDVAVQSSFVFKLNFQTLRRNGSHCMRCIKFTLKVHELIVIPQCMHDDWKGCVPPWHDLFSALQKCPVGDRTVVTCVWACCTKPAQCSFESLMLSDMFSKGVDCGHIFSDFGMSVCLRLVLKCH